MKIVADAEDARSPAPFIMKGESGLKPQEYAFS